MLRQCIIGLNAMVGNPQAQLPRERRQPIRYKNKLIIKGIFWFAQLTFSVENLDVPLLNKIHCYGKKTRSFNYIGVLKIIGENNDNFSIAPIDILTNVTLFIDNKRDNRLYNTLSKHTKYNIVHIYV